MTHSRAFLLRKLHSLSGVIPVGVFLVEHLWTNAKALGGERPFAEAVREIQALPMLPVIEIAGIFVPLAFHALYGVVLAFSAAPNAMRYTYTRNWMYVLQRVTGGIAFVFVAWHLWEYRVHKWLFGLRAEDFYGTISAHLSSTTWGLPLLAVFYLVGITAAVFHFANGLWGFGASWGITLTRRAQQRSAWACAALGVGLFVIGASTVIGFATGSRVFGGEYVPLQGEVGGEQCGAQGRAP